MKSHTEFILKAWDISRIFPGVSEDIWVKSEESPLSWLDTKWRSGVRNTCTIVFFECPSAVTLTKRLLKMLLCWGATAEISADMELPVADMCFFGSLAAGHACGCYRDTMWTLQELPPQTRGGCWHNLLNAAIKLGDKSAQQSLTSLSGWKQRVRLHP